MRTPSGIAASSELTILAPAGLSTSGRTSSGNTSGWSSAATSQARDACAPDGMVYSVPPDDSPVSAHAPSKVVMSAQLARGDRRRGHIFERASSSLSSSSSTKRMQRGSHACPATRTVRHYFGACWKNTAGDSACTPPNRNTDAARRPRVSRSPLATRSPRVMGRSGVHAQPPGLGSDHDAPSLQIVKNSIEGTADSLRAFQPDLVRLLADHRNREDAERLLATTSVTASEATRAQKRWTQLLPVMVAAHPGHLLTIRHTRAALEQLGYRFPARSFGAPELAIAPVRAFYRAVDAYLENAFGMVSRRSTPTRRRASAS